MLREQRSQTPHQTVILNVSARGHQGQEEYGMKSLFHDLKTDSNSKVLLHLGSDIWELLSLGKGSMSVETVIPESVYKS